ncbi:M20/M25/M40 family metallo-hydrolase [Thalassotalea euphylliae]|uniref:M20/M25/M40 family metallo-hydrolase n=1 Tax=Thalassotalea euphylliae TaxID=1655234 RepID=A0A3E0TTZ8_9GAMM|nr:M20/M25/M40 family metallo-hydrolase [Thalassotalea euphylliae]REL27395.1 M20/M25/M40 family metallo-hydrolase [Thalassotalea euphylliae]
MMKFKHLASYCCVLTATLAFISQPTHAETSHNAEISAPQDHIISLANIKKDIEFLASDALKGRKVFTPELDRAANYIAARFKQAQLEPFKASYRQQFDIYNIKPAALAVTLNGKKVPAEKLALASTAKSLNWTANSKIVTHVVGKEQDLRQTLSKINQQGDDHFLVIHPSHQDLFQRYQAYFAKGLTKLNNTPTGTILMVLDDSQQIDEYSASGSNAITTKALTNVIGVLPGKTKPEEVVLFTAHYDHIGTQLSAHKSSDEHSNTKVQQDLIYNGADDNASGVAGVLNLARYFAAANNNDRTLIFVAFTAEEIGGYGSKHFAKHLPADNVVAMVNMEMIGKTSKFGAGKLWMTGFERSNLAAIMNQAIAHQAHYIQADPYPEQQLFYRSDNATFARLGVPAHSFSTVQLDQDKHYHAVSDEVATLNLASLEQVLTTIAKGITPVVSGVATPSRVDSAKVAGEGKIY